MQRRRLTWEALVGFVTTECCRRKTRWRDETLDEFVGGEARVAIDESHLEGTLDCDKVSNRPFILQTRWLIGHVIIFLLVVLMANLSLWQLRRLHQSEHYDVAVRAQMSAPPIGVTQQSIKTLPLYRNVNVVGSWDAPHTFFVRYPIHLGQEGYWMVEPVIVDNGGGTVLVNRGWIPLTQGQAMPQPTDADGGSVQIEGTIQAAQKDRTKNGTNGATPPIPTQTAITDRWVQLVSPAGPSDPVPLDPPDLTNGSHFSYTLQWLSFCLIAIGGWISVLRRAKREAEEAAATLVLRPQESSKASASLGL
jgi:cytochrome oxidase assembly protein ShyY1